MHIESFLDVINACRFCFMCRHIDTTACVSFREADIPRGRALILDRVRMNGINEFVQHPDFVNTMYDCALSAACRYHCVSSYDEAGLVLAARRDIADAGLAPAEVEALGAKLQNGSLPGPVAAACPAPTPVPDADIAYVIDGYTAAYQPEIATAFLKIAEAAGLKVQVVRPEGCIGKALLTLGYEDAAKKAAEAFADTVSTSGVNKWVTSSPAVYDALVRDYPELGVDLGEITVEHTSTYLLGLQESGLLKIAASDQTVYCLDSDFLRNYHDVTEPPRALLNACGCTVKPFGTNPEESYGLGEGAVVFDLLRPALTTKLRERLVSLMDTPDDVLVTASPYTKYVLAQLGGPAVAALSLEEVVAGSLAI
jgi:Fe-S oxidoreductase